MIFLKNDYSLGACPKVLDALIETNMVLADGYCEDEYCYKAQDYIRELVGSPSADVHFIPGGTLANLSNMSAVLQRPFWSVISPDSGHICVHETGAIEATGHKINHVKTPDGKLRPEDIEDVMIFHEDEHYVLPKAIYISDSTETGEIYTKAELLALRAACDKYDLYMYIDGARMAMALTCEDNDVVFEDFAKVADMFYIGGTKCGALFGEAVVIVNDDLKEHYRFIIKQRGALLAKGKLLGVQFNALLRDNTYLELGAHANKMAKLLREGLVAKGYEFAFKPQTNMAFTMVEKKLAEDLAKKVMFETYPVVTDTHQCIRLVTSWGTTEEEITEFLKLV